ncbi:hypothetical protein [Rhodopila sp.]|uniref:hypothetical protein n=1 Tax=Rhodopila sp. TaxID=2480087 RepID=UPI003D0EB65E
MSINSMDYRVVVRRIAPGKFPYRWEIQKDDCATVTYSCSEPFDSMQSAFEKGQAWLSGYVASTALGPDL